MALLSRKVDYALLILSHLHQHPEGGCARAIAERFRLKSAFAANVLKLLCRKGFVVSQRGLRGGYQIARPARTILLSDLLDQLGEGFCLTDCTGPLKNQRCDLEQACSVRGAIQEVDRRIRDVLQTVTVADLIPSEEKDSTNSLVGLELLSR
ncbi:MAG: Rrf2 family transcriptional regulator [Gemmataceae bacterium]